MIEYHVEGGFPIKGTIHASGNKNAALPCIAACLLTPEPVVLHNIPEIEDTRVMIEVLKSLGVSAEHVKKNTWRITCDNIQKTEIPPELSRKISGSILFAGPLAARCGKAVMSPPGGDVIGRRRVDTHFLALQELGVRISANGQFVFTANKLAGADIFLDEDFYTSDLRDTSAEMVFDNQSQAEEFMNLLRGESKKI